MTRTQILELAVILGCPTLGFLLAGVILYIRARLKGSE
jgi:hypothetical protein